MLDTHDIEIREAFHKKVLKRFHDCSETFVVDELGVEHGRKRIDIAVVDSSVRGFEIKSSLDTLDRLEQQLGSYMKCFGHLSLIVAPNHLDKALKIAPEWIGITEAQKGSRGGIHFSQVRRAKRNPQIDLFYLSHFLWRAETVALLEKMKMPPKELRGSRKVLYEKISNQCDLKNLTDEIRSCFFKRSEWRSQQ